MGETKGLRRKAAGLSPAPTAGAVSVALLPQNDIHVRC